MAEPALRLDGRGPLHEQIRRAVAARIAAGEWRPGHRIPFETDLAADLGTSRMTVNRALKALADDGLIERRRKAGSFVAPQSRVQAPTTISTAEEEAAALGGGYRFELLASEVTTPPDDLVAAGTFAAGTRTRYLMAVHRAARGAFELERRWINLDRVPEAEHVSFAERSPGAWLLEHVPWTEAEHTIHAVGADAASAGPLRLAEGTPCLSIERRTWIDDETVTFVRLLYPGAVKRLVGRFHPAA